MDEILNSINDDFAEKLKRLNENNLTYLFLVAQALIAEQNTEELDFER